MILWKNLAFLNLYISIISKKLTIFIFANILRLDKLNTRFNYK